MANLNLSEFGEKLFVADADHTFIWDTVGAISKRVSRNSWLNSGTLTSDAPVTISQTWGNNLTTFKALVVNAAGTSDANSAAASKFLDLQLNGVSKLSVDKSGIIALPQTGGDASALICGGSAITNAATYIGIYGIRLDSTSSINWAPGKNLNTLDTILLRDGAANTLALRNGANGQTFSVYGTYPGAAWERFTITAPTSGNVLLGTYKGTGGIARGLEFQTDGVSRWSISTAGHLLAAADNTYDIGASGANRPRNVYAGTSFFVASTVIANQVAAGTYLSVRNNNVFIDALSSGVLLLQDGAGTSFGRFQLGGTTDAFPAIARDGAGIKFTGAAAGSTAWIKVPPVAVGSLPVAATAGAGARAFVNDALAPVFGNAVANGGSAKVPVYSDGSAWYVG